MNFDVYPNTVEPIELVVTADRVIEDADVVRVTALPIGCFPDDATTWALGQWLGTPARVRVCRVLVAGRSVDTPPTNALAFSSKGRRVPWIQLPLTPLNIQRPSDGQLRIH